MQGLADGLEDCLDVQAQEGADAGGGGGAEVGYMVDLVLVQADGLDQVDLDFVAGGDAADQVLAARADVLGDGEDRRDVVARVGVVRGQERVVVIEFTDGDAVGPGRPFGGDLVADPENTGAFAVGGRCVGQGLRPGSNDRARLREATATEALSMIRLMTISVMRGRTSTGSAATAAILCANCCSRGRLSSLL
ncbi:hypothetical protein AHiyo8_12560 [Arthrobacter sp. Hiyo8]|nr:hypothetical protein AHiyo8_12560 [Arthrobacter sp. Hiyo8]